MTLVSNTSPLCYLALIGHTEILPKLYGNVHITQKVLHELRISNWSQFAIGQQLRPTGLKFIPTRIQQP
jgi:predicted nucleic acid-binding protein